ncbi:sensor histidine kinase [Luteimonas sp. S4-F44]|uniref:sensor histidine kinase n=1 Tax=Luteimonas sp. S4-F44 TaxID=2925842 RepID=UPI001F52F795|nr:sensor histidine kinase [Luteimonas sp. S4-F44]UNK43989.1 sensor histidine kinase [Luteimonas sp. S4-F44]
MRRRFAAFGRRVWLGCLLGGLAWLAVCAVLPASLPAAGPFDGRLLVAALLLIPATGLPGWWLRRQADTLVRDHARALAGARRIERDRELRDLLERLPDGTLLVTGGQVRHANAACAAAFGYPGSMTGVAVATLVADEDRAAFDALLSDPEHMSAALAPRMRRQDATGFRASLTASRTRYEDTECVLVVLRDLSEVERMRDALAASNAELRALAARMFTLQEDERRAISRELHDDVGQSVTAMKLAAGSALVETDALRRRDDLEDIATLADATIERLRDISVLLRPPQLDALGLEAALRAHAERQLRNAALQAEVEVATLARRPAREVEQACFRIAQEALTNIVRHARASRVALRLYEDAGALCLHVGDDGVGFPDATPKGLGLVIMRERAQSVGGHLDAASSRTGGTRIEARLPYDVQAAP